MADCTFDPGTPEQESCLVKEALKAVESAVKAVEAGQTGLEEVSGFLQALSGILSPLAAILFLVLMIGPTRELIATRKFTIKIAGFELSAQEASEQLRKEIDDLRKKVSAMEASDPHFPNILAGTSAGEVANIRMSQSEKTPLRVLWVDDRPSNNAVIVAGLRENDDEVVLAKSTDEAAAILDRGKFDVVISDMGRPEGRDAGVDFQKLARDRGDETPFAYFTSWNAVHRHPDLANDPTVVVATPSSVELNSALDRLRAKKAG